MVESKGSSKVEDILVHAQAMAPDTPYPSRLYAWYVIGVFVLANTFSFIDRQILSLLVGPMKRDLALSDTQVSLLLGISFVLFFAIMGLPIGRLVDHRRRVSIIALGVLAWSVMTALCGTARAYWQLFFYRMGVGVGEAALSPSAYSITTDYFPPKRLGLALGVYSIGIYIGAGAALVIGSFAINWALRIGDVDLPVIGHVYSWQLVFFVVGLPGLLVALWVATLREPARRGHMRRAMGGDGVTRHAEVPFREVLAYLRGNARSFFAMSMCFALMAVVAYGTGAWVPTVFVRTFGWTTAEIGRIYGVIIMVFGTLGVILGGAIGDWLRARGYRNGRVLVMACTGVVTLPFAIIAPLMDDPKLALALIAPASLFATFTTGIGPSALMEMMPNQMRGFAAALLALIVNLVGLGIGPTSIALVTDYVFKDEQMLRYSLAIVPPIFLVASSIFGFFALRPYRKTLDDLPAWSAQHEAA